MKKMLVTSYIDGITDSEHGEKYSRILRYFVPEFITALVLYSLIYFIDSYWIAHLKSTSTYATLGTTNTILHLITKMAEGFSVGTIVLSGMYNGKGMLKRAGHALVDAFWVTCFTGAFVALMLYVGAPWIYYAYGVPEKMILLGTPYLRLRAIGIFFMFMYFAFIGFLRGVKNTRTPMIIFIMGALVFLFVDYGLIFGHFGMPALGLQGSAWATIVQYAVMLIASAFFVLMGKKYKQYSISLCKDMHKLDRIKHLLKLSFPVMLDKSTLAVAYIWLGYMINPMGKYVIASYTVIKDLERLAIIPAAAFAQVVTFLVSNAYGQDDWQGIKTNIKKIMLLASIFVCSILIVFSLWPEYFIGIFDQKGKFTNFSAQVFPLLSILVFFDLLQLILAGALRGAANVKIVMLTRLSVFLLYFIPVSLLISSLDISNIMIKFLLIYGSFYVGNGLMGLVYIWRFRGERWKTKSV